jgi:hypothetical protein
VKEGEALVEKGQGDELKQHESEWITLTSLCLFLWLPASDFILF